MKKLMIYPYHRQVSAVARYARFLEGYLLTFVVSPKSDGYDGQDISCVDGGTVSGITITSSFQEGLDRCDSILISSSLVLIDLNYYEEKIKTAISLGKEVLITRELERDFTAAKVAIPAGTKVLGSNPVEKNTSYDETTYTREISVPVITIFQAGELCSGLDALLLLSERFEKDGYRVSRVSSDPLSQLFGIHMLPDYMYGTLLSYEDKIVNFNHHLLSLVQDEQPDLLLLEVKEPILPYSDRITNHFGVIPGMIAKAVQADVSILNLYYDHYHKTYLNHLRSFCSYALNANIGYISLTNLSLLVQEFDSQEPMQYMYIDQDTVLHSIHSDYQEYEDCLFFNAYDSDSVDLLYHDVEDTLSQNQEVVRIW